MVLSKIRPSSYMFVLSKQSKKETYFDILDSKEFFLDLKSETLAKSKKSAFCKGVSPWFLSKNRPFPYIFFSAKKARKKHFLIFWLENKAFWTLKVKFSQSRKKSTFCKGVSPWFLSKNRPFFIFFFLTKKARKNQFFIFWKVKNAFHS